MIKTIISLTRRLADSLNRILSWLESNDCSADIKAKFVDLAPTDKADKAGIYSEAILFATSNVKVFNIALTGPYGSGKSSIIQSFLKTYRRPALHISLAAFAPEADSEIKNVSRQEIERSILQQMLYGADASKLPLSRFKRIQTPSIWSIFKSLYITLGVLAIFYLFSRRGDIIDGKFFTLFESSNWVNVGLFAFAVIFLWVTFHHFYVASFGLSLKSISLKDVEIKPAYDDQTSILNRHLDEIVYFFQSTDYELVIIEDLDRFNEAEIFVTLREINSLVNENAGVKRTIRFLYALRDDMFINTDRTKFFEFIIPVIPIINTSNSIDMVLKQGKRLEIDGRLDRQFLREVSRYLNDLRLIQNIFNEYAIYMANLESDEENLLDANKLLAILIYKNVYPRDFEQLHRGTGNFARILNCQNDLIRHGEVRCRADIEELEKRIEVAEQQTPSDLRELRQIYAMALIEKLPAGASTVSNSRQTWIELPKLVDDDEFEQLIMASHLFVQFKNNYYGSVDISKLQTEVDSKKSYLQRKEEIESKLINNKKMMLQRVHDLRLKIPTLRMTKLNELLRLNADRVESFFKNFEENGELARFLILEGHLDDTYYQYTSLFHSGRLSPNDNKFLIKIRAFVTPEPSFPLDNPKEVIAAMRDEDFRQSYVLNVKLVDTLLENSSLYPDQTQKLFEFLSSEFVGCEDFFDAYYTSGHDVAGLLLRLVDAWESLVPALIASARNISHVTQLIGNLPLHLLKKLAIEFDALSEFVAANLPEILVNGPKIVSERLECLNFEVNNLTVIKEHSEIVRSMFEKGRYVLTIANLEYIYQEILEANDINLLHTKNFTTIRLLNNVSLLKRVERDFDLYVRDILLELEDNSKEDAPAILAILGHDTLDQVHLRNFLERQAAKLPTLDNVPKKLHSMLFQLNKIEATWMNCLDFLEADGFEADSLIGYLELDIVRASLLQNPIPSDSNFLKLRQFLINAGSLSDNAYKEYAHALPKPFAKLPEKLESAKLEILIDEGKITFSKENLEALADSKDLQVLFVAANIHIYLADPDISVEINDDFRDALLRSDINNASKLAIVKLMDLGALVDLPERSALVGAILGSAENDILDINEDIAYSLIKNSSPIATQISILNKYHSLLSDEKVHHILANLPEPYSEIKTGYRTPRLKKSKENLDLVKWLDSRNIISSWGEDQYFANDIRVNLYRS